MFWHGPCTHVNDSYFTNIKWHDADELPVSSTENNPKYSNTDLHVDYTLIKNNYSRPTISSGLKMEALESMGKSSGCIKQFF